MSWEVPAGGIGSANFTNTGCGFDGTNLLIGDFDSERIVKTTLAGAYVGEIILASAPNNSVQGVAYDTSDGTYWVCHYGASTVGTVRQYNSSGTLLNTIACAVATTGPSGCAYDVVNDRVLTIWDDGHMRSYNCATLSATPVEDVTLDASLGTGSGTGPDGVTLDPTDPANRMWVSSDATNKVYKINRGTGAIVSSFNVPVNPEGMSWVNDRMYLCCDTFFHSSVPNGNRVFIFEADGREVSGVGFQSKLILVDLATSTTTQVVNGAGFRPKVVIALGAPTIAQQATAAICYGAADVQARQWALTTRWNDNDSAAPITVHEFVTTKLITRVDGSGGSLLSAVFLDSTHDGFRLSVTNAGAQAHRCAFLCLAGDQFDGYVGTFNSATSTGVQAVTGVGFQPKAVLIGTNKSNTTTGIDSSGSARFSLGVMTASAQWSIDTFASNSVAQTVAGAQETSKVMLRASSSSAYSLQGAYSSMDSDGFSVNLNPVPAAAIIWGYVALGGSISVSAGTFAQPSSTGAQNVTGMAFQPTAVLLGSASAAADGAQAQTRPSFGLAESSSLRVAYGNSVTNGSSPSQAGRQASESLCITHNTGTGTTVVAQADFTSFNVDGFTVNWSTADATARKEHYLAIADQVDAAFSRQPRYSQSGINFYGSRR